MQQYAPHIFSGQQESFPTHTPLGQTFPAQTHAPLTQLCPAGHEFPQAPQWATLLETSVQASLQH
ncbi:MAG TPA: hypothetical protein VMM78_12265 [Thermomicrobiales bacterium]|nr:hypothetical protein [Thermomicrobiales bacterium]